MLSEMTASLGLFRWAVFCLLAYKCYQLISQYVLPWIQESMQQEQNILSELVSKDKLAMIAKQKIENQLHDQQQLLLVLEQNVQRWHTARVHETTALETAAVKRISTLQAKQAQQREQLFFAQSIMAIVPQALDNAEAALIKQHASNAAFDSIINTLATSKPAGRTP